MFQPPTTEERSPTPPPELIGAALQLYLSAFGPLVAIAAVVAAIPTLLGLLIQPEQMAIFFVWTTLLLAVELAAHTAVLWTAYSVRRGTGVDIPSAVMAAFTFGPRYFAGAFLLLSLALLSAWSIVLLPLAIYVVVRLALYGPAIVLENLSIVESFRRSWRLVERRWWRTFGMVMMMLSVPLLASLIPVWLMENEASLPVLFLANVGVTALVIPLLMCFMLMLFEDYRRVADPEPTHDAEHREGPGE